LTYLRALPKLRVLNLSHCRIADWSLGYLEDSQNLRMLYLEGCSVSDVGVKRLHDLIDGLAIYR